jgi:choline-sulfatase
VKRAGSTLGLLVVALALLAGCARSAERGAPPQGVLVLLVDCLRADALAAGGSERGATPALDALASGSVLFTRAFSPASWTRPAMPSLWTGLYPSEHGVTELVEEPGGVRGGTLADEVTTVAEGMRAAGFRTGYFGYQHQLSSRFNLHQGYDAYLNNLRSVHSTKRRFLAWLDEEPGRPFFAHLHFMEIHWPYRQRPATRNRYGSEEIRSALDADFRRARERIRSGAITLADADRRKLAARYYEALAALDMDLGGLLAELEERGLLAETLIVLTSDHGEELGERGGIGHGHTLFDELIHVPFVWKLPASWQRAPRREIAIVETRSLAPTLFEIVGQPVPERVSAPSLVPWLGDRRPRRPPVDQIAAESNGIFAVRTERWKLVTVPAERRVELYDLAADPAELRDVAADRPEELAAMNRRMRRWRTALAPLASEVHQLDQETIERRRASAASSARARAPWPSRSPGWPRPSA